MGALPDTGVFSTDLSDHDGPQKYPGRREHTRRVDFSKNQYQESPQIGVGLNAASIRTRRLDCESNDKDNIRIEAQSTGIEPSGFTPRISTWWNSILNSARINWLEAKASAKECQIGEWIPESKPSEAKRSTDIRFAHPFAEKPVIVVWLKYLDLRLREGYYCIQTYSDNTTAEGFTLHIDTAEDQVYKAGVTWIAFKKGKTSVQSGSFGDMSKDGFSQKSHKVSFQKGKFSKPPTILSGINMIYCPTTKPLKLASEVSDVSASGFTWIMQRDEDWMCNAHYIAL
ncbi:hypothetical protein LTS10_013271 [Elasticomyces elasticus]|nr:hypothetical protein LTS10_013271 [Elasticomyces elasticus]